MDIPGALDALGIDYTLRGDECSARCPYHEDRSPSWSMNIITGEHNCFSCGFGGSFAKLVAFLNEDWTREEVRSWITDRKVRDVVEGRSSRDHEEERPELITAADMWEFVRPPLDELDARWISREAAAHFSVKWSEKNGTWIIPIRDPEQSHAIIGWQEKGLRLFRNHPEHLEKGKTLFGLHEALKDPMHEFGRCIVVESPLDALRFWMSGHPSRGPLATYGAEFTGHQVELIQEHFDDVILAFDNDVAGRNATVRMCERLNQQCRVFAYGETVERGIHFLHPDLDGRDPGNLRPEELRYGVKNATPAWRTGFGD